MRESKDARFEIKTVDGRGAVLTDFHKASATVIEVSFGNVIAFVGTESMEIPEGAYIYIPSGLVYRIDSGDSRASVRVVTFPDALVFEHMDKLDMDLYYMFSIQSRGRIAVFEPGHPIYEQLAYSLTEICDEYAAKDVCYKLPIRANVYMLVSALLRHYMSAKNELDRMVYHNVMRLRPALDYIAENCGEKIYIDTLAQMLSVSPDYFTKMFRDSISKTPIDYINAVRVNRSLELLAVTDVPLSEIAEMSGFANANYFHKIFKTYMETSPLAYRKSSKN